jgi:hypothetical protein
MRQLLAAPSPRRHGARNPGSSNVGSSDYERWFSGLSPQEQVEYLQKKIWPGLRARMHKLDVNDDMFEGGREYAMDEKEREALLHDAHKIVNGIDPALSRNGSSFVKARKINVEEKHVIAECMMGFHRVPSGKSAYVHATGAVAVFPHGSAAKCLCGHIHMP